MVKDKNFCIMDEIIQRSGKARSEFKNSYDGEPEPIVFEMDATTLVFRAMWRILAHVELISAGSDVVQAHWLGYCAFYAYTVHCRLYASSSFLGREFLLLLLCVRDLALPCTYTAFSYAYQDENLVNHGVSLSICFTFSSR